VEKPDSDHHVITLHSGKAETVGTENVSVVTKVWGRAEALTKDIGDSGKAVGLSNVLVAVVAT
jgi:hypothetical protein